jgi:hypothetical protein
MRTRACALHTRMRTRARGRIRAHASSLGVMRRARSEGGRPAVAGFKSIAECSRILEQSALRSPLPLHPSLLPFRRASSPVLEDGGLDLGVAVDRAEAGQIVVIGDPELPHLALPAAQARVLQLQDGIEIGLLAGSINLLDEFLEFPPHHHRVLVCVQGRMEHERVDVRGLKVSERCG